MIKTKFIYLIDRLDNELFKSLFLRQFSFHKSNSS